MHTVTKISEDSETVFYIYFLICNKTKNKQLPISKLLALNFHFNSLPQLLTKSLILLLSALLISVISVENQDKKTLKAA